MINSTKLKTTISKHIASCSVIVLLANVFISPVYAKTDRQVWVEHLQQLADPVLLSLNEGKLIASIPAKQGTFESDYGERKRYSALESFGRLMSGIAPWLELGPSNTAEGELREKYIKLTLNAIHNAVDPESPDYMNFGKGKQPLVDAAYLAQAFIRAPTQLWNRLPSADKKRVFNAFEQTRKIADIPYSNWLLFAATLESFYIKFGHEANLPRIEFAIAKHMDWYVGDGLYSDGEAYHWDYYNSYVIHPMLVDVLAVLKQTPHSMKKYYPEVLKRSQRYSAILERQISPEGTYPIVGRSAIYRFGAFQTLAQMALLEKLPTELSEGQVRAAMTEVMQRLLGAKGTYTADGWLQIGVVGHQPKLAEAYISTGSLYMASLGFLPLGLPEKHSFWTSKSKPWTSQKIWSGDSSVDIDKALKDSQ